jgi:hypothetical protein
MKTAVSVPDEVFDEAEHLAKRLRKYIPQLEYLKLERCGHEPWREQHAQEFVCGGALCLARAKVELARSAWCFSESAARAGHCEKPAVSAAPGSFAGGGRFSDEARSQQRHQRKLA